MDRTPPMPISPRPQAEIDAPCGPSRNRALRAVLRGDGGASLTPSPCSTTALFFCARHRYNGQRNEAICQAPASAMAVARKSGSKMTKGPLSAYLMRPLALPPSEMCRDQLHGQLPSCRAPSGSVNRTANVNEYSARYSNP